MCTCRAARLPWRSFLGRSAAALHLDSTCREIFWDAVASLVGFGAPNNYFASFSVGRTDCICLVEFFASAQLPNSPCVFSWDAVASLFIMNRLRTSSAASVGKTDFLGAPNRTHSNSCFLHPLPQQSRDSCYIFASLKYSAFMQLIMVHWCGGFGDEQ